MGSSRKLVALFLWWFLFIFLVGEAAHASPSRHYSHRLKMNPNSSPQNPPRSFFGALPRSIPIPPSAPSKNHNDIGLQSSATFP
ncbi:hypothetical protein J1N35_030148 [Gossypium stocksii]|uniref:Uncharacterized protein n=1 Tax=Gossypium stocksii TaxID=47602 RepID=A0A9D3UZ81_9ROSI|nr:hypothetical protein J1N35_030148 [Gossypium stocksii]